MRNRCADAEDGWPSADSSTIYSENGSQNGNGGEHSRAAYSDELPPSLKRPQRSSSGRRPSLSAIGCQLLVLVLIQIGWSYLPFGQVTVARHADGGAAEPYDAIGYRDPETPEETRNAIDATKRREQQAEARKAAERRIEALRDEGAAAGVVCRSLRSAIVAPLLDELVDRDTRDLDCGNHNERCSEGYHRLIRRACGEAATSGYTGRWEDEPPPAEVDLHVLSALAEWLQPPAYEKPMPPEATWARPVLEERRPPCWERVAEAKSRGTDAGRFGCHILDFGCGDAEALIDLGELTEAHAPEKQLACIDIYEADATGQYTRHVLPDPSTAGEEEYCEAVARLEEPLLASTDGEGMALVTSAVTFHHLPTPTMRACVWRLVAAVLSPQGVFALSEWDNTRIEAAAQRVPAALAWERMGGPDADFQPWKPEGQPPSELSIWFDLAHAWNPAVPAASLPLSASALKLENRTDYASWTLYAEQAAAAGLAFNETLQRLALELTPSEMAEKWPARNFEALLVPGT